MKFDVAALPAEDFEPLAKALSIAPPEKRGEVYMRIQNAGREFLTKAKAGKPPSVEAQTDPIKRAVFGALTKQLPAPPPQLDPLKREALGSLEKAVLAGIRGAARGLGDALGVTGRAGAMRQMRAGYRAGYQIPKTKVPDGPLKGVITAMRDARTAREWGRRAAAKAGQKFVRRGQNTLALSGLASGGAVIGASAAGAFGSSPSRPSKKQDQ